jgi:FkbM family methyltransferase
VHDEEYLSLARACALDGVRLVLDVGANYGYSVTTLVALGYRGSIYSFEPLACHRPALQRLEELIPDTFKFRTISISNQKKRLLLLTPMLGKQPLTALTFSIQERPIKARLEADIQLEFAQFGLQSGRRSRLRLIPTLCRSKTLDEVVRDLSTPLNAPLALKVDVEGHELAVLRSAISLIGEFRPLLFIERPDSSQELLDFLSMNDFIELYEIDGNFVCRTKDPDRTNRLFVPKERLKSFLHPPISNE